MNRIAALALLALASPAAAQDPTMGEGLYLHHCATCHGVEARGDGPMGPVLLVQPVDLTALAENNGGVFPAERVIRRIDGRDPLVSHGSDMPVFGPFFEGTDTVSYKTASGQPVLAPEAIVDLVTYLESIQGGI